MKSRGGAAARARPNRGGGFWEDRARVEGSGEGCRAEGAECLRKRNSKVAVEDIGVGKGAGWKVRSAGEGRGVGR